MSVVCYSQTSNYERLFKDGLITEPEYEMLKKRNTIQNDTLNRIKRYDSLYQAGKISIDEYKMLKEQVFLTMKQENFNPKSASKQGKNLLIAGIVSFVASGVFYGVMGDAINKQKSALTYSSLQGYKTRTIVLGVFGSACVVPATALTIQGAVLKSRANKFRNRIDF